MSIVPLDNPRTMAKEARRAVADGCRTIYVKYDGDEQELIDRLEAIRTAIGTKAGLRVDFNQGLSPVLR